MTTPSLVDRLLGNPLIGLAPWIVYSIVEGEGRLEEGAAIAFGLSLGLVLLGQVRGNDPKLLEFADVIFFGALAIVVAVASEVTHDWLERWSGEVSNIALMVISVGSIAVRRPFTLAYAKEEAPRELWENPAFLRTNYVITWAWAIAFIIQAASGFFGDLVLDDPDNIWTGWIIQTLPLIVAAQFTLWYPRRVRGLAAIARGESTDPPPPVDEFLVQVTPWIAIAGVIVLAIDSAAPWWVGIGLIVIGMSLTRHFQVEKPAEARA